MPAASAPYLFTNFLKGYMDGTRQRSMDRFEKAKGLMDIAAKQAEIIDTSANPEARAYAHKIMTQAMKDADKSLKPEPGLFTWIGQAFGKKGKDSDLQDPHDLYKDFMPYGAENKQIPVNPEQGGQTPGVSTATAPPPQAPPQASGAAPAGGLQAPPGGAGAVPGMMTPNEAATVTRQTGQLVAPEVVTPDIGTNIGPPMGNRADIGPIPSAPELPGARPAMMTVPFPRKAPIGSVVPEQATGKGAEKIMVAPDEFDYRVDGVQVSPREYRRYILGMAERTGEGTIREREREAERAGMMKSRAEMAKQDLELSKQKADNLRNSPWYQGEIASGDPSRVKMAQDAIAEMENPGLKIENATYQIEQIVGNPDPKTGQRMRSFVVIDKRTGLPTGKTAIPDMVETPSGEELATLGLLKEGQAKNANFTYNDAVLARGKMILDDKRTQVRVEQLKLSNAGLENQLNQIKLKVAKLNDNPDRQWINGIYDDVSKLLLTAMKETSTEEDPKKLAEDVFKGTVQQLARYGISFEEFLKVNGRDPAQLIEIQKQQYLKEKSAGGGAGKPVTKGF
jgi:hypothetical protein